MATQELPETGQVATRLAVLQAESDSLVSQHTDYILRLMGIILGMLYASTYALSLKVPLFGYNETVVHQLMIGSAGITFFEAVIVATFAYYTSVGV